MRLPLVLLLAASVPATYAAEPEPASRPNILWLIAEDMSPRFGCYGSAAIRTPHVDRLAAEGTLFERALTANAEVQQNIALMKRWAAESKAPAPPMTALGNCLRR